MEREGKKERGSVGERGREKKREVKLIPLVHNSKDNTEITLFSISLINFEQAAPTSHSKINDVKRRSGFCFA